MVDLKSIGKVKSMNYRYSDDNGEQANYTIDIENKTIIGSTPLYHDISITISDEEINKLIQEFTEIGDIVVDDRFFICDFIAEWSIDTGLETITLQYELNEDNDNLKLFDECVDKIISDECKKRGIKSIMEIMKELITD